MRHKQGFPSPESHKLVLFPLQPPYLWRRPCPLQLLSQPLATTYCDSRNPLAGSFFVAEISLYSAAQWICYGVLYGG